MWLGQVYALGGGWGGGRTADQTSPCAVGRESDPSNVLEVYCYTLLAQGKRVSRFFLQILLKSWKVNSTASTLNILLSYLLYIIAKEKLQ